MLSGRFFRSPAMDKVKARARIALAAAVLDARGEISTKYAGGACRALPRAPAFCGAHERRRWVWHAAPPPNLPGRVGRSAGPGRAHWTAKRYISAGRGLSPPLDQAPLTRTSPCVLSEERRSHSWCAPPPPSATSALCSCGLACALQMFATDASGIDKAPLRPSLRNRVSAFGAALKPVGATARLSSWIDS